MFGLVLDGSGFAWFWGVGSLDRKIDFGWFAWVLEMGALVDASVST